jgi:hypothetical protein
MKAKNLKVDSECFSKTGKRRRCKSMRFTTAGVLCGNNEAKYLFCHVAHGQKCSFFEYKPKKTTEQQKVIVESTRKPILICAVGKKGIGRSYSMKDAHKAKFNK